MGGPSTPRDLQFSPLGTGLGVFFAIAIPLVVLGYTRAGSAKTLLIVLGVVIGVVAGTIAGTWVSHRGGKIWRGPQL